MMMLVWFVAFTGIIVLLIAALGILRLPDALSRQHAATKAATLSLCLFLLSQTGFIIVSGWDWEWLARLLLLLFVLLVTLPLASHALARSAVCEQTGKPLKDTLNKIKNVEQAG